MNSPFGIRASDKACYLAWLAEYTAGSLVRASYGFSPSDADDVQQEILLHVWRSWKYFDPAKSEPQTFIAMVVRKAVSRLLKKHFANQDVPTITDVSARLGLDDGGQAHDAFDDVCASEATKQKSRLSIIKEHSDAMPESPARARRPVPRPAKSVSDQPPTLGFPEMSEPVPSKA